MTVPDVVSKQLTAKLAYEGKQMKSNMGIKDLELCWSEFLLRQLNVNYVSERLLEFPCREHRAFNPILFQTFHGTRRV